VVDSAEADVISCKTALELSYTSNYILVGLTFTYCSSEAYKKKTVLTIGKLLQGQKLQCRLLIAGTFEGVLWWLFLFVWLVVFFR